MSDASPKTYPRGLPYKAPEELAEREAKLRRWTQWLVIATLAVVAWMIGTGIFIMKKLNRQGEQLVQADNNPDQAAQPAPSAPGNDKAVDKDKDAKAAPKEKEKEPAKAKAEPESQRDRFLDALGKMTGVHLYQCYLNIGLLADCTEGEVYTEEEAQKWLERILSHMDLVDKQLEKIGKSDLDAEEKKGLERCRQVSGLLRNQARELKDYWKNTDKERAAKYHKAREEAWAGVSEVLQIPKDQ